MLNPTVPISWGEAIDKMTILEIKFNFISDTLARGNVRKELDLLSKIISPIVDQDEALKILKNRLFDINRSLWDIEDKIREKERAQLFDNEFIELARSVYIVNDKRASVKRDINKLLNSDLIEEKSYAPYENECN